MSAGDSWNVAFLSHARQRMRKRHINDQMVFEVLTSGNLVIPPEPDMKSLALRCRMARFVSGMNVAVVVAVEYPAPELVVVTVLDIQKD
ncbi:MAG: DUF4258 domain-containing protein [Variovorax sp.]|nr:MAG: DUF4258 domain-containing protein [Variovorax sp.]